MEGVSLLSRDLPIRLPFRQMAKFLRMVPETKCRLFAGGRYFAITLSAPGSFGDNFLLRASVSAAPNSRTGRHLITDPYLRCYFRFMAARQNRLEPGIQDQALVEITHYMVDFIGTHTFEELYRESPLRPSALDNLDRKQLPLGQEGIIALRFDNNRQRLM
jgi:hypothetical protein